MEEEEMNIIAYYTSELHTAYNDPDNYSDLIRH